jgi:energy-coupling factor transport system substrate-specific component
MNERRCALDMVSTVTHLTISLVGIAAFLHPFWSAGQHDAQRPDAPIMAAGLITLSLVAMLLDAQRASLGVKQIALLGILSAMNAALRFAETALPGPGGFTPLFLLIICGGYAYGPRFGFLLGLLSLLASAIVTAGIGPWLPFQMYTAGWMGLSAGWLAMILRDKFDRREHIVITAFGFAWGFGYGAIMNLWSWPYTLDPAALGSPAAVLQRYAAYYAATSAVWDLFGAFGNAVLIALFAPAAVRALQRFRSRLTFRIAVP